MLYVLPDLGNSFLFRKHENEKCPTQLPGLYCENRDVELVSQATLNIIYIVLVIQFSLLPVLHVNPLHLQQYQYNIAILWKILCVKESFSEFDQFRIAGRLLSRWQKYLMNVVVDHSNKCSSRFSFLFFFSSHQSENHKHRGGHEKGHDK